MKDNTLWYILFGASVSEANSAANLEKQTVLQKQLIHEQENANRIAQGLEPTPFVPEKDSTGCGGCILFILICLGVLYYLPTLVEMLPEVE